MQYYVVYERAADGGWGAYVPDLVGVGVGGYDTQTEAQESIRIALEMHLAGMREDGTPIPAPSSLAGELIEVA